MTYLANKDFTYSIKHVVYSFKKDEVFDKEVPADEIEYMIKQKFIRESKEQSNSGDNMTVKQLEKAIATLTAKMAKEMDKVKLKELDEKKQEFEEKLAKLKA